MCLSATELDVHLTLALTYARSTRDRVFLDSDDVANPNDMSAFYRQSLMSQANHRFGNEVIRPGAFRMRVE